MNTADGKDLKGPDAASRAFCHLVETVQRLRAPDGCPWDRAQTHESLKAACIEEAAEVVCGINILSQTGKAESLCEELGDLLLQVLMHALIAQEEGLFTLEDVLRTVDEKMIRRHPHVFGAGADAASRADTSSAEELQPEAPAAEGSFTKVPTSGGSLADWKAIKAREKRGREWEEAYLPAAFDEAEALIDVARRRKQEGR